MTRREPVIGQPFYRAATIELESEDRSIRFVASDESVDRYGDVIRASGWKLKNFKKNPVLLWAHQSRELPIGRVTSITVEDKQLVAHAEFVSADLNPKAEQVLGMVRAGVLNAVSVGFLPIVQPKALRDEKNERVTGFEFVGQELTELSVVPVPANPMALALSRAFFETTDEFYRALAPSDVGASAAVAHHVRMNTTAILRRRAPL